MIFAHDQYRFVILFLPLLILVIYIAYGLRKRYLLRLFNKSMWPTLMPTLNLSRRFWKRVLFILAIACVMIALLRPQYGLYIEKRERHGQDIFIAIDTSASMKTTDVPANRFHRARQEVKGLINSLKGDRIGLIVFAGTAFVQCPLTTDYNALNLFLDDITIGSVPTPGTDIATAIKTARLAFNRQSKNKSKILIVISDGESFENDPLESAKVAQRDGLTIFTVGIGTSSGDPIPVLDPYGKMSGFKRDKQGNIVVSQLNELLLQSIASATDGHYFLSNNGPLAMDRIYRLISQREKSSLQSHQYHHHHDRYYWFLIPAFLFLFIDLLLTDRKNTITTIKTDL